MEGIQLTTLDVILIVAYVIVIYAFGLYFSRHTKSTSDYFFSGRKFAWWIIAFSMIASIVGSYSFIKYSAAGFKYGMSSSMSYLNDWFIMPLWMFGWLPIMYYSRIISVPEYFERRFDRKTRIMALIFITLYLVGYIGINFYTLGVALNTLLGLDTFLAAALVAVGTAIYVSSGGQTAVIMTDLLQGVVLLVAGLAIFFLGFDYLGGGDLLMGIENFWKGLPSSHKYLLADFNAPHKFHFIGVFWQDAIAGSIAVYFFNQGILMRFLALKSVHEGRKAIVASLVVLFPLAVLAVGNAGWLGASMHHLGVLPEVYANPDPKDIFVVVTKILVQPGLFGLVMAALLAALMSSTDTLINATSAVMVNDILKPFVMPGRDDASYLKMARWISIVAAAVGLSLVPLYMTFKSIYLAHATFVATITPPMAVCVMMGFMWKRMTGHAAFWTLFGGGFAVGLSIAFPQIIEPLAHGVSPEGDFKYMRALFGLVASGVIGVVVTFITQPKKSDDEIKGLTLSSLKQAEQDFKGAVPVNKKQGKVIKLKVQVVPPSDDAGLSLHPEDLRDMSAEVGDMIYVADGRWYLGGLRAAHTLVGDSEGSKGVLRLPSNFIQEHNLLPEKGVRVEKLL